MFDLDAARDFLVRRLAQEGLAPLAVVRVFPGRWRGFSGSHALAVTDGLLWLACPQLIGDPSVASVASSTVIRVEMHARRPLLPTGAGRVVRLDIRLRDGLLRYAAFDDEEACEAFVTALRLPTP